MFYFHISIDDRRRSFTRRRTTVYRVWNLTGIWFLSAAAAAHTSTVGDSPTVHDRRRVMGANSLSVMGYLFEVRAPVIIYHLSLGVWRSPGFSRFKPL